VAWKPTDAAGDPYVDFSLRSSSGGAIAANNQQSQQVGALTPAILDAAYPEPYNGAAISTRKFLLHLLGHFNYHLGQIDYLRRFTTGDGAIPLATF